MIYFTNLCLDKCVKYFFHQEGTGKILGWGYLKKTENENEKRNFFVGYEAISSTFFMQKSLCTVVVQHHIRNNNSKGVMNSKVPKYSTISTNIWAERLHEIDRTQRRRRRRRRRR